jgi:hypothetical protein
MDIVYISGLITEILKKVHKEPLKHIIDDSKGDRIVFACPYCGDSDTNPGIKRGNLHFDTWHYKCYNGGCGKWCYLDDILKDYSSDIDPLKKLEMLEQLDISKEESKKFQESKILSNKLSDYLKKFVHIDDLVNKMETTRNIFTNLKPVDPKSDVGRFLSGRHLNINDNLYEADYWYSDEATFSQRVLVIFNRDKEKIIGMQLRFIAKNAKLRYKTSTFTEIYELVYGEKLTPEESSVYDRVGYIFNILNIDFNKPVTVFEGYLDSTIFPNSVGMTGTETDIKFLSEQGIKFRFFFDYDNAGHIETEDHINAGDTVFLWGKFLKLLQAHYKEEGASIVRQFNSKKRDLNEWITAPYYTNKIDLESCFSMDKLDIMYTIKPTKKLRKPFVKKSL